MRKYFVLSILALFIGIQNSSAQGFEAPSDSNAVVYFVRVTNYARNTLFDFFHETQLIGKFNGANYMRYECPPGKQIFWASSENKQFLNCDLKPGGTYIVLINIIMGFWKNNLVLEPITPDNVDFERTLTFVKEHKALKMSPEKIAEIQKKLDDRGFIADNLDKFERGWINRELTEIISPDMAIPESYLK